jgi:RNA polymerase sigma-70 factor (ECF subfamily)
MKAANNEVTQLLVLWSQGDQNALEQLLPLVYEECRHMAARQLRRERQDHTLNPTAAQLMRRILVDYARARNTRKRGGSAIVVSLTPDVDRPQDQGVADVLAIDEALQRLAAIDGEQVRIIELRFFAGLTVEETAHVIGRSARTVKREWQLAKAWLYRELYPAL